MTDIIGAQELIGQMLVAGLADDDDDDISGEWDDIMGAGKAKPRKAVKRTAMQRYTQQAVAAKRVAGGAIVQEHAYTKARVWPLGFDSVTTVAAGATASMTATPQQPFKPKRLAVAGSVASSFLLTQFVIGNQPQFSSLQFGVPADMFGPTAFGTDLDCDTAQANTLILLSATNLSGAALRFTAGLIGQAVQ